MSFGSEIVECVCFFKGEDGRVVECNDSAFRCFGAKLENVTKKGDISGDSKLSLETCC